MFAISIKCAYNLPLNCRSAVLPSLQYFRRKHTNGNRVIEDTIVITDDSSAIVCWHPEKEFPYEFTKPLPNLADQQPKSVLRTSEKDAYKVFKKQSPESAREELMKITYTTKHRWFPRSRDKKAKKTAMDRRYL